MGLLNNGGLGLGILLYAQDLASDAMARVEAQFKSLEGTSKQTADAMSRNLGMMKAGVAGLAAGGGIIAGLTKVGTSAFQTAARFETYEMSLAQMLGSGEKAKAMLEELASVASKTPFEFEGLVQASKQMLAFGFEAERIPGLMTDIADAASALGGGTETIDRIIRAFGQMQAKGRVMGEELLQLMEAGLPVYDILQEQLGLTGDQIARIGQLGLDSGLIINALLAGIRKEYGGLSEQLSNTAEGMISNIGDARAQLMLSIGTGFLVDAKDMLRDFRDTLTHLADTKALRGFGQGLGQLVGYLRAGVSGLLAMVRAVGDFFATRPQLLATITTFIGVGAAILTVVSAISLARGAIGAATLMLRSFGLAGTVSFGSLLWPVLLITGAIVALRLAYDRNLLGLRDFVNRASLVWKGFWSLVTTSRLESGDFIGSLPQSLRDELAKAGLLDITVQLGEAVVRARAFLNGLWQGVVGVGQGIRTVYGWVRPVFGWIGTVVGWVTGLLGRLGVGVARAGNAPDPSRWERWGRIIGTVLGLVVARLVWIRGYRLTGGGIAAVRDALETLALRGMYAGDRIRGLGRAIVGLPRTIWRGLVDRTETLALRAMYARDWFVRLGRGIVSLPRAISTRIADQLLTLRIRAMYLGDSLRGAGQRVLGFGRNLLAAGRAAFLSGLQFFTSPWGIAILVITALAVGAYLLIRYWGPVKGFFNNLWSGVIGTFQTAWNAITGYIARVPDWVLPFIPFIGIPLLIARHWDTIRELPGRVIGWLVGLPGALANLGSQALKGLANAFFGAGELLGQAGRAVWDWLTAPLRQGWQMALQWGRNLVTNLIQGIREGISNLAKSAGRLAQTVADFLGFSSPTRLGPGSTADRWMPNLVGMLAAGLIAGQGTVASAAGSLAATMQQELARPVVGPAVQMPQPELPPIPALQVGVARDLTTSVQYTTIDQPTLSELATTARVRWATPEWQAPDLIAQARVSWAVDNPAMPPIAAIAVEQVGTVPRISQTRPATGMVTIPQPTITPVRWPAPASPVVVVQTPVTAQQGRPGLQKQTEILQPIQLVLDGRVIAETIARIKADDDARSFRY